MNERIGVSLEQIAGRMLELLDSMDLDGLGAMLTDDAQSVDEITRGWTRGRAAIEAYMSQLKDSVSRCNVADEWRPRSRLGRRWAGHLRTRSDLYDGRSAAFHLAPTSLLFRFQDGDWKIALIHTVPIPEQA